MAQQTRFQFFFSRLILFPYLISINICSLLALRVRLCVFNENSKNEKSKSEREREKRYELLAMTTKWTWNRNNNNISGYRDKKAGEKFEAIISYTSSRVLELFDAFIGNQNQNHKAKNENIKQQQQHHHHIEYANYIWYSAIWRGFVYMHVFALVKSFSRTPSLWPSATSIIWCSPFPWVSFD